jgi:hypothetical protein
MSASKSGLFECWFLFSARSSQIDRRTQTGWSLRLRVFPGYFRPRLERDETASRSIDAVLVNNTSAATNMMQEN